MLSNGAFVVLVTGGRWAERDGRGYPVERTEEPEGPVEWQDGGQTSYRSPCAFEPSASFCYWKDMSVSGSFFIYCPRPDVCRDDQSISECLMWA